MNKKLLILLASLPMVCTPSLIAQSEFQLKSETLSNPENEPAPVHPVPHPRQLKWQETEFYAFFHYGMNTYTNLEWGNGGENVNLFAPTKVPNPKQWLETAKKAGMKGGIAVVKHHDGFCLWPTETTKHRADQSNNENAKKTNIPKDFAAAAKELGLKYGFYVSPWDRNSAEYGKDTYVKNVFLRQCAELAQYGTDQFEMWFDGANGGDGYYGGEGGSRQIDRATYYDTPNLRDTVHKVCPDCVLWGVGGEARWIGNEQGWAGETNWCTENRDYAGEGNGMYGTEGGWFWLPGESDAKATNKGWFWHNGESPLSAERLFQMYLETVGRNATLILNLPPDNSGELPAATVKMAEDFGNLLKTRFGTDLAKTAKITADVTREKGATRTYDASNMTDDNKDTYWAAPDGTTSATITIELDKEQIVHYLMMMEYVKLGQRVKEFEVETSTNGTSWTKRGKNKTTIGYKRIIPLNGNTTSYTQGMPKAKYIRLTIKDARACPTLHTVAVY